MAELKTRPTDASVEDFLAAIPDGKRRADARVVNALMARVTGEKPVMWGASIVGFGRYRYDSTAARDLAWFLTGFSPRKAALTLYIMPGYGAFGDIMARLGRHKTGKGCLYIKTLADIDIGLLEELVAKSVAWMRERYRS